MNPGHSSKIECELLQLESCNNILPIRLTGWVSWFRFAFVFATNKCHNHNDKYVIASLNISLFDSIAIMFNGRDFLCYLDLLEIDDKTIYWINFPTIKCYFDFYSSFIKRRFDGEFIFSFFAFCFFQNIWWPEVLAQLDILLDRQLLTMHQINTGMFCECIQFSIPWNRTFNDEKLNVYKWMVFQNRFFLVEKLTWCWKANKRINFDTKDFSEE